MLTVKNLTKKFVVDREEITVLSAISFTVPDNEFFVVVGESGSGKSTLLRLLASLLTPTSGELIWEKPPKIGYVFQNYALFPFLTVRENIEFGLKMRGVDLHERHKISKELIDEVGLEGFADLHPKELSGGMKQRVGIARALAISPNVLLLDEPFSSLDELTAENLRNLLLKLWKNHQITVIMITHLIEEAIELGDKIAILNLNTANFTAIITNPIKRPRNLRSLDAFRLEDSIKKFFTNSEKLFLNR